LLEGLDIRPELIVVANEFPALVPVLGKEGVDE
jgi:hypothetical protein